MKIFSFEIGKRITFISRVTLELCFLSGLLTGSTAAFLNEGFAPDAIYRLLAGERSAAMIIVSLLMPFALTYLAVRLSSRGLLLFVVFFKAALFSYSAVLIGCASTSFGWLIACLILASDCLCLIAYHWLWIRCSVDCLRFKEIDFLIVFFAVVVILLCEHFWFYPFAKSLFINL